MLGSVMAPLPGMGAAAPAGALARAGRGLVQGGVGGTVFGAGSAISEGKGLGDIAGEGATSGAIGAALGGPLGAALGRGLPTARGQRAAAFAEQELKAPIPQGLASDIPAINAATAKIRSWPFLGSRVSSAVDKTQHAAGEMIGDIANTMAGGAGNLPRATASVLVKPGLQQVIADNKATINAGYDSVRNAIDNTKHFTMPKTKIALSKITRDRFEAGQRGLGQGGDPTSGLDQFLEVAQGANFNGAHRARYDARSAGNPVKAHPGYDKTDYNNLTKAMTEDIRSIVYSSARGTPAQKAAAVREFERVERQFGPLKNENEVLERLVNAGGEGGLAKLLGSAREKGGNLALLAQLKNTMRPDEWNNIGAVLLNELGKVPSSTAENQFSLGTFVTNWSKVSPGAKRLLFEPQHLANIEEIFNLGQHIKSALRESNTSHTTGALIFFDLARDAILLGVGIGTGAVTAGPAIGGAVLGAPAALFARWLSNPATASSMGAWSRAYRAATLGQPTPARIAAFKIATRNLANNIGVPAEQIMKRIAAPAVGVKAEDEKPK
jgi:hypothetical protein